MQQSLLEQGLDLLIYGMGTVFVFLTILVGCTLLMSQVVRRVFPEAPEVEKVPMPSAGAPTKPVSPRILAVIEAAIHMHRNPDQQHNRQQNKRQ